MKNEQSKYDKLIEMLEALRAETKNPKSSIRAAFALAYLEYGGNKAAPLHAAAQIMEGLPPTVKLPAVAGSTTL